MKTLRNSLLLVFVSVILSVPVFADSAGGAGAYLKMGVGARALGMGSAFVGVANDATAAFWNPAGLALLEKPEASFMHANLTLDRKYNFFNYAHILKDKNGKKKAVVALSHARFGIDGIPETRLAEIDQNGNPVSDLPATRVDQTTGRPMYVPGENVYIFSYFDDVEMNTFGSYARKMGKKFYGGVNVKRLSQTLFTNAATTWGMDLGFLYEASEKSRIGLAIRDIGESLKWDTESGQSDKVPLTTTFGASYQPTKKITLAADLNKVQDMDMKFRAGAEYWLGEMAALRLGSHEGDLTLGASFKLQSWRFDYSYVDETLGAAHRMSAMLQF
ncbi:MAG: PorV/PorQ family protein [Candidatus Riflebacteria bacterium]|nr:PorV/PorQ family protein [Candidatus Riflebacteria bacterium]